MENIKSGITFGIIGGLLTFLFGGWSVAVLGLFMGTGLGLLLNSRFERTTVQDIAKKALPTALTAGGVLVLFSLIQNYVIQHAIGKMPEDIDFVLVTNILGFILTVLLTTATASFRGLSEEKEQRAKLILLALIVISFPFIDQFTALRWTAQIIFALIFVILGLGLNIVVGYAGLLDLGYAAFFAIGAYTTGILSSPVHGIEMNFWLVIWIAAAMAAVWGLMLGAPTLPLRGDYLAIVTLGFGEIVPVLFKNLIDVTIKEPFTCWILPLFRIQTACITLVDHEDLTFGEKGISPIGRPSLPFIGEFESSNPITWYFLIIAIILLSVFLINRLRESRLGRAWMAIREDELAAAQMGINPVATKLMAFAMGATFSGFAGAFYAAYIRGIFPSVFDFSTSIIILCVVILGGLGNINGVIVGGLALMTADRLFLPALKDFLSALLTNSILPTISNPSVQLAVKDNANPILYRFLLFGLTLVIMMRVRPEGLLPNAQVRQEMHAVEETPLEEATKSKSAKKR
ncbi:MAG: branched-chain amino acid ABC transporter permease [Anaerolineales bacterium]|nr:branched-chain amino acid ABC transporter permease [Anaerolineales bacterium]